MNIKDIIMAVLTFRTPGGRFETEKAYTFGLPFAFKVSLRVRSISPHMTFVTCALSLLSLNGK